MRRAQAHFVECQPRSAENSGERGTPPYGETTYKYYYFSEGSGYLWGVPLMDATVATVDAGGVARNVGGGIVGLPFTGHPFQAGDVIDIRGTTGYNGVYTLTSGTSEDEIQFTKAYSAETFDGTERVVKYLDLNTYGGSLGGIAGQDTNSIFYYPIYDVAGSNWILIIQPDGTMAMDTFSWPASYDGARDCIVSGDDDYLYVKTSGTTDIIKFNISTGAVEWYMDTTTLRADPLMDYASASFSAVPTMGLDSNGNGYAVIVYTGLGKPIVQLDAIDGSLNYIYTDSGQIDTADVSVSKFGTYVDNEQGIFLSGGQSSCLTTKFATQDAAGRMNNLWVRTLDNSAGDKMRVGGTYASGGITYTDFVACNHIAKHNGYFYILICDYGAGHANPTHAVYKYEWTGTEMSLVATIDFAGHMPTEANGIFFDLWDNMVIVNNCPTHGFGDGTFWYYDEDGNYITTISGFNPDMLDWWNATAGWSYQRGNVIPNPAGSTVEEEYEGTYYFWISGGLIYGFEHLIGETLKIFIDGVVYPDQVVSDEGTITLPCTVTADSEIHIGLAYYSKLAPMKPLSQPNMMKKKATCKQMGISVHNTDDSNGRSTYIADSGVRYGVHDDDMKQIDFNDPQWKNKCDIDGLFTGTAAVHVPDGFGVNMPLQIMTDSPLPAVIRAMIPKVDVTGT